MAKKTSIPSDHLPACIQTYALNVGGGSGCGNPLAFVMQHQLQDQWCWSAVSVSVSLYYHPASAWTQCTLVNSTLGQTTCCTNGSSSACNRPWTLDHPLTIVGNFNTMTTGKATFPTVKAEIDNCRPLCLRIGWNRGGGHFVAVYGYINRRKRINIGDPWYGNAVVSHGVFPSRYHGGGLWTHSYFTQP